MRRRFTKALLLTLGVALLAGTAGSVASSRHAQADSYNVGIVYSRTGLLAAYGAEYVQGLRLRPPVRHEGHGQGQRQDDQPLVRRRRDRPGHGASRR